MKSALLKSLLVVVISSTCRAADLTAAGDWVMTVTAADLTAGAGSDLRAQFESVSGVTTLTITNAPGAWSLRARCGGSQGYGDVAVFVKRTSAGTGTGSISGGDAYIELPRSDIEIFSGSEARSGISLQFKLIGLSRNVPPATYLSSIIFTVVP